MVHNNAALVDIIIPIHNRPDHTAQTLQSLYGNTPKDAYNLYLIDDGSSYDTEVYLEKFYAEHETKIPVWLSRNEKAIGPAASRNAACKFITDMGQRSRFLYHSDNDVYFKADWLKVLIENYSVAKRQKVLLLGGGCHPYLQNNRQFEGIETTYIGIKDAVSGYSQLMEWDTWDTYGPFSDANRNEEKKIAGSEDWAFCQKIIKHGFLVGAVEPEVVIHTGQTNTYGEKATGHETFKPVAGVDIK